MGKEKYYAREVRDSYYDGEIYFNSDDAVCMEIAIFGNSHFGTVNYDMIEDITSATTGVLDEIYDSEIEKEDKIEVVKTHFSMLSDRMLTDEECKKIYALLDSTSYEFGYNNNEDDYCTVLEVLKKQKFDHGYIRGCVQGDWQIYVAPADVKMDYIEAVYFNTGTEFKVCCCPEDKMPDFDDDNSYWYYTSTWGDDNIKKDLATQIGCNAEDVVLSMIVDEKHITEYVYEDFN